jgi:hypothetical protein
VDASTPPPTAGPGGEGAALPAVFAVETEGPALRKMVLP